MSLQSPRFGRSARLAAYTTLLALATAVAGSILWYGQSSTAAGTAREAHVRTADAFVHVLLAMVVVIVTARVLGAVFRGLRQPPVMGEVVGGILLGPSFFGTLFPAAHAALLPASATPFLDVIAQLGIVLYMFIVGLELDLRVLRTSGGAAVTISQASIVLPFVLGMVLALGLYDLAGPGTAFVPFALFVGVSLSITAFPVLARILTDKRLQTTELGMLSLACAAMNDLSAWCLLAVAVSATQAAFGSALVTIGLTLLYVGATMLLVRPAVARAVAHLDLSERLSDAGLAAIVVAVLLSALATEVIGIHALFGAFLLGAVVPHTSRIASEVTERMEGLVRVLFLPAFFALTGMRTQMHLVSGWHDWLLCAAIIAVATAGKFGGTFIAAISAGLHHRDAAALGVLMNTRGLVELIALNIGLDMGVISPRLFTLLVIMALVTTLATTPILDVVRRGRTWSRLPPGTDVVP